MKKRSLWLVISSLILILVIVGLLYTTYLAKPASTSHTAPGAVTTAATPLPPGLRTFQIVPTQTTASYSVYENLIFQNKPNNDAIGTTHAVQGSFHVRTGSDPLIAAMTVTVDLRTLQTDADMRDNYVRRNALQTDSYPYATFVSLSTQGLPTSYTDGQSIHFQLTGNLTMHGKTNKATFDVQGKLAGKTIIGTATSTIYMTDFGIQPPNLANIAVSQNKVQLTITFVAREA